jgi:hypothetical protein
MPLQAAREEARQEILLAGDVAQKSEEKAVTLCTLWLKELKLWERLETFERAFTEDRMCLRAAPSSDDGMQKKQSFTPKPNTVRTDNDVLIRASIRDMPLFQKPENFLNKKKNELGLQDVSAVLLSSRKKISAQVFAKVNRQPVFIPLPNEEDLQLFYLIECLAKKNKAGKVYEFYKDARARITRIKYGSDEDMKTTFLKIVDDQQKVHYRYGDAHETSGPVDADILAKRRNDALFYKSRVLTNKINENNEVTVKIRHHEGGRWPQAAVPGPFEHSGMPKVPAGHFLLISLDQEFRGIIDDNGRMVTV